MNAIIQKLGSSPSKRLFFGMVAALFALIVLMVGILVFGNKMLKQESNKLLSLKLETKVLDSKQTALATAMKDLESNKELGRIAQAIVPQDKDQARAVREVVKLASDSGIILAEVAFPTSTLGSKVPTTSSAAPAAGSTGTTGSTSGTTGATGATPPAAPPKVISQAKPVQGIAGVYGLEMTIKPLSNTDYPHFIAFLDRLEHNRRTAQVTAIKITPDGASANQRLTFELTLTIYLKP